MENSVILQWKEFSVPVDRLSLVLKNLIGENFDGLICEPEQFYVMFKTEPTQEAVDQVNDFWNNAIAAQFNPSLRELISVKINEASAFGHSLILDFAVENVQMGITQMNKTRAVSDYCANIQRYLDSGSLYAAVQEITAMINAGVPSELAPFITEERLNLYKSKLEDYLEI